MFASSTESMGEFRLRQSPKLVVESGLHHVVGSETTCLSDGVWISLGLRTERHDFLTITAREVCPEPRQSIALVEGA